MNEVLQVVTVLILVGFGAVFALVWPQLRPAAHPVQAVIASKLRSRLIVTLKTGESFAGIVVEADEKAWVLRSAEAIGAADDRSDLPVDGEIILLTTDIAYAQKP